MRKRHFETLQPCCPVCRSAGNSSPLRIAHVECEKDGHIVEGVLHCCNQNCLREFPIIDGVPIIVTNIRQYVTDNILPIFSRRDLGDFTESMFGDCCGPGSMYDSTRQHLSSYAWDHYGDLDPQEKGEEPRPGSMLRNLKIGCELAGAFPDAAPGAAAATTTAQKHASTDVVIDVGCSVGRSSFALAERGAGLVLGVDLSFSMLRTASELLRHGVVRYPRRRVGLVYERREFPVHFPTAENVDFWVCDAAVLPFKEATFTFAASMNLLDCVYAPREFLTSLSRVLRPGGKAMLFCPYDWSASATPPEAWLGGHSQRSPAAGSPDAFLRSMLTPGEHPNSLNSLRLVAERDGLPWHVRLHDRSTMTYKGHLVVAEKV